MLWIVSSKTGKLASRPPKAYLFSGTSRATTSDILTFFTQKYKMSRRLSLKNRKTRPLSDTNLVDDAEPDRGFSSMSSRSLDEEKLGLKLHDSAKFSVDLNDGNDETFVDNSGSSEEFVIGDDDDDRGTNNNGMGLREEEPEEEYGFSSITGAHGQGGRAKPVRASSIGAGTFPPAEQEAPRTVDLADLAGSIHDGLAALDNDADISKYSDTLDGDLEPIHAKKKASRRGSSGIGRFLPSTSHWAHPKYCWRRQALARMGRPHRTNSHDSGDKKARRKTLLIVGIVVLVILAALAGSIAAWQVNTQKSKSNNDVQQQMQNDDTGSGGDAQEGDEPIVVIPGGEDDLTPTEKEPPEDLDLDLGDDFDPTDGIQKLDCAKCQESCRPCLPCVDLFGAAAGCDKCEPCQVCMPCFADGGGTTEGDDGESDEPDAEPAAATTIVEMSYLQSYTGIDMATLSTEEQVDDFQDLMVGLLDEYIDVNLKDWVEVVCTYNTQRLTASAPRYRKHAAGAGANLRRMLRGVRNLDTHGDGDAQGEPHGDIETMTLGSEKGGDKPAKCDTPEKETCADMCALNCSGDSGAVAVCQGECRLRCCISTALSGGGPDTGEDEDANDNDAEAYDPWSMGLLCEDGSPPVKDDAADTVGKCPTDAPTSQPTAAPMPEDGNVCSTDDELTCKDL